MDCSRCRAWMMETRYNDMLRAVHWNIIPLGHLSTVILARSTPTFSLQQPLIPLPLEHDTQPSLYLHFSSHGLGSRARGASSEFTRAIPRRAKRKRHLSFLTQPPTACIRRSRTSRRAVAGATSPGRDRRRRWCSEGRSGSGRVTGVT